LTSRFPTRRAAIATIAGWVAAAVAACDSAFRDSRKFVDVATTDQVPVGGAFRTTVADQPIVLVNVGGDVRGFLAVCTHEGCPLGWNPEQHLIRCPCHGGAYDTNGKVVDGPPPLPLTRLETRVRGGKVSIVPASS